jgi:hypothetical protein
VHPLLILLLAAHLVSLTLWTTSSSSWKGATHTTGPKISSCMHLPHTKFCWLQVWDRSIFNASCIKQWTVRKAKGKQWEMRTDRRGGAKSLLYSSNNIEVFVLYINMMCPCGSYLPCKHPAGCSNHAKAHYPPGWQDAKQLLGAIRNRIELPSPQRQGLPPLPPHGLKRKGCGGGTTAPRGKREVNRREMACQFLRI